MERIASKHESQKLFEAGAFGNKLRTWASVEEMLASGFTGQIALRYKRPGAQFCRYHLTLEEVPGVIAAWTREGADPALITCLEMGPHDGRRMLQGEVMRSERYYDLRYSTHGAPMRTALAVEERHAAGLAAVLLLRRYLCASSYADLQAIFDRWPESVVEFSAYNCLVGELPHRNTVFWEVRNY